MAFWPDIMLYFVKKTLIFWKNAILFIPLYDKM